MLVNMLVLPIFIIFTIYFPFLAGELNRDGGPLTAFISMLNASLKNPEKRRTLELDEAAFLHLLGPDCQALDFHFSENTSQNYR